MMFTKTFFSTVVASALFVASASAICPGYKFGISQIDSGVFQVFDNSCNVVNQVTTQNPCKDGAFDCGSSGPTAFTGLHLDGVNYGCRADANSGSCSGHPIQVCCN